MYACAAPGCLSRRPRTTAEAQEFGGPFRRRQKISPCLPPLLVAVLASLLPEARTVHGWRRRPRSLRDALYPSSCGCSWRFAMSRFAPTLSQWGLRYSAMGLALMYACAALASTLVACRRVESAEIHNLMKSSSSRPGPSTVSCSTPLHAPHRLGARSNGPLRPLLAWLPGRRS